MQTQSCSFKDLEVAPPWTRCPDCKRKSKKKWLSERRAIDISLDQTNLLRIFSGVYWCERCERHFRFQPDFIGRDCTYTNRVVSMALASVFEDGLPITKASMRLERDFGVKIPESTIRYWIRQYGEGASLDTSYDQWIARSFSGVLCIDEVYQGKLAILLAVDSSGKQDRLVGYQLLDEGVDSAKVEQFLRGLKEKGIEPEQIVTDGSALYPEALANVWPKAPHQLCIFHQTQSMVKAAGKATAEVRKALPDVKSVGGGGRCRAAYAPKAQDVFFKVARSYYEGNCQDHWVK